MASIVTLRNPSPTPTEEEKGIQHSFISILPYWWSITKLWFTGKSNTTLVSFFIRLGSQKWKARGYVIAAFLANIAYTMLLVQVSYFQKNFNTAMADKNQGDISSTTSLTSL